MKNILDLLKRNKRFTIGLFMLLIAILLSIFAPVLAPHDPTQLSADMVLAPCSTYPLGTDSLGRDILSMILYGGRTSLTVGVVAALISAVVGTTLGALAGFYGGKIDSLLGEFINVFMMMPTFFLILIVVALFGSGMEKVMIVIGLTTWTGNAKLMRAQAMNLRNRTFVKSAEAIGEKKISILFHHIIPNGIFPVIANTTMGVASAILTESSLSFLGLGDPNVISWGRLISDGKSYLTSGWWICVFAGIAVIYTVVSFYFIGDGLNVILNPKLKNISN